MKQLFLLWIAFLLLQTTPATAQGINFFENFHLAFDSAKSQDKPVFCFLNSDFSGDGYRMERNIEEDADLGELFNAEFINLKITSQSGTGRRLVEIFEVRTFPALLFFNSERRIIKQKMGAVSAEELLKMGNAVLEGDYLKPEMVAKYNSGDYDLEFLRNYVWRLYRNGMDYAAPLAEFKAKIEPADLREKENYKIFGYLMKEVDDEFFQYFEENFDDFVELYGKKDATDKYNANYFESYLMARKKYDPQTIKRFDQALLDAEDDYIRDRYLQHRFWNIRRRESAEAAYSTFMAWLDEGHLITSELLNNMAWDVYNAPGASREDVELAVRLVEKSIAMDKNFYNMDTYAWLEFRLENYAHADQLAREAITIAKEKGIDYSSSEDLLNTDVPADMPEILEWDGGPVDIDSE